MQIEPIELARAYCAGNPHMMKAGPGAITAEVAAQSWWQVVMTLLGQFNWMQILPFVKTIFDNIFAGQPIQAIIDAIIAYLTKTPVPPGPVITLG